jgi:WD40 repeat protein
MDPQGSYRKAISVNIKTGEITAAVPLDRILDLVYLSPAGDRILVCGGRGVPRVYSVETGQLVFELKAPDRIPYGNGLWSSSGKWIMTPDRDGSETIWDSASGKPARTWPNIGSTAAAMDPQDSVLATANDLGRVEIRDVHTCELLRVIEDRIGWVETKAYLSDKSLRFSPDGKYLALAGGGPTVKIWGWRKASSPYATLSGHAKPINSILFGPDDKTVVTGSEDDTAKVWDAVTGRLLLDLHGNANSTASDVFAPAYGANGRYILAGATFGEAMLWDAADGRLVKTLTFDKKGIVLGDRIRTAASPRGDRFITVSSNGTGALWDFKTLERISSFTAQPSNGRTGVEKVEFSIDGGEFLIGIGDGKVFIFDAATGTLKTSFGSLENGLSTAELNPAGGQVLIADKQGRITVWDAKGGKPLGVLEGSGGVAANEVHFSPDGARIVAACSDHTVRVWASRGGPGRTLEEQKLPAEDRLSPTLGAPIGPGENRTGFITARFSPDGRFIAGGTEIGKICIWEAMSGRQLLRFDVSSGRVTALCFGSDGTRLAAATENAQAFVWNLRLEGRAAADLERALESK